MKEELEIYEYSVDESLWDTTYAALVMAKSRDEADKIYMKSMDAEDIENMATGKIAVQVKVREIQGGMLITPFGYDRTGLNIEINGELVNL